MVLRTQAIRIIKQAGLEPWPKVFQNLRSSRETELVEQFPVHVVTSWLGNTPSVAQKHYLQTHDEHFRKAIEKGGLNRGQNTTATHRTELQDENRESNLTAYFARACEKIQGYAILDKSCPSPRVGLEPTT